MAITYVSTGTFAYGATSIAPAIPSGYQDNDLFILVISNPNNAVSAPSGWTEIGTQIGTGTADMTGAVRIAVFYKWVSGTQSSPTISGSSYVTGIISCIRGVDTNSPFNQVQNGVDTSATTSVSCPSVITTADACLIFNAIALDKDSTDSDTLQSGANANLTSFTEVIDRTVVTGVGGGIAIFTGFKTSAGSTGNTTATGDSSTTHAYMTIALKPAPATQTIIPNGYANTNSFGSSIITTTADISATGYSNSNIFGLPLVEGQSSDATIYPNGYANTNVFGSSIVAQIVYGAEAIIQSAATSDIKVAMLDSTHAIVAYIDEASGQNFVRAVIATIDGTNISYGTEYLVNGAWSMSVGLGVLDSTHAVIAYCDSGQSNYGNARIAVIDGTTITFGTEATFNTSTTYINQVAVLDNTHFAVSFNDYNATPAQSGASVIGVVSGSTIAFGSKYTFNSATTNQMSTVGLDSTHFVVSYQEGTSWTGQSIVGTVSNDDEIAFGTPVTFNTGGTETTSTGRLTDTSFIVSYRDGSNTYGNARVGLITGGSTIAFGTEYTFNSANTAYTSVAVMDNTHVVIAYEDTGGTNYGRSVVATISNDDDISFTSEYVFNSATTTWISASPLNTGKFIIAYRDEGNSNYGTAIVGEIATEVYIVANGISDTDVFGLPTVEGTTVSQDVYPNGYLDGDTYGSPTITTANDIVPNGCLDGDSFGSESLLNENSIIPNGYVNTNSFGLPEVTNIAPEQSITANGLQNTNSFGGAVISAIASVIPVSFVNTFAIGSAAVLAIATIVATGIGSTTAFGDSTVSATNTIVETSYVNTNVIGSHSLLNTNGITIDGYGNVSVIGSPSINATNGIVTNGLSDADTLGSPTIIADVVSVVANGFVDLDNIGSPSISFGSVNISLNGILDSDNFGSAIISTNKEILLNGLLNNSAIGQSTLVNLNVISPTSYDNVEYVGSHSVSSIANILTNGLLNSNTFGSPTVSVGLWTIESNGLQNASTLGSPTIGTGLIVIPNGLLNSNYLGTPTIATVNTIAINGIANASQIGSETVLSLRDIVPIGVVNTSNIGQFELASINNVVINGLVNSNLFGGSTITTTASVQVDGLQNSNIIGLPSVVLSDYISVNGYADPDSFGQATLSTIVNISPIGYVNVNQIGQPSVDNIWIVAINGLQNTSQFGASVITTATNIIEQSLVNTPNFGNTIITTQSFVAATGLGNISLIGEPIAVTTETIIPVSLISVNSFGDSIVTVGISIFINGFENDNGFGQIAITTNTEVLPIGVSSLNITGMPIVNTQFNTNAIGYTNQNTFGQPQLIKTRLLKIFKFIPEYTEYNTLVGYVEQVSPMLSAVEYNTHVYISAERVRLSMVYNEYVVVVTYEEEEVE